jgi:hypothetical protein
LSTATFFSAAEVTWQDDARCNDAPFDFTPDKEDPQGLAAARAWCNLCPVRTECLSYALLYHLSGYWGGTDTAERRKLSVARNRVKCPVCRSKAVIYTEDGHEICQHCGTSWTGNSRPRLPEEAAG